MSEWKTYKLGDFITHKKGFAFKSNLYKESGCPIIRVTNFTGNSISLDDILFIDNDEKVNFKEVEIKEDDIIIATVGSWPNNPSSIVGRVIKVPKVAEGALLNQNAVIIYPNKNLDKKFLYYVLKEKNFSNYLVLGAQGSANQASIKLEQIYSYEFSAPEDKAQQQEIAKILTSLDDKIELNHKMNQTLEAMAQALFKEWFVDFNFPGFDGELVDGLPKGWRMGKVKEMYKTTSGGTPSRAKEEYYENGTINWVKSKELNGTFIFDTEEKITIDAVKNSSAKLIPKHSVLVAMYGATVGEYAITTRDTTCNQAICAVIEDGSYPFTYFFEYFKINKNNIIGQASGSAQQNISQALIQQLDILVPPIDFVKKYHSVVESMFIKMEKNLLQIQSLIQTRDTLLPKLMSGKIEIIK